MTSPSTAVPAYVDLAKTHYENFPVGSILVKDPERTHLHRIYAFARTADDLADELVDRDALFDFRAAFENHLPDYPLPEAVDPFFAELRETIAECKLDPFLFRSLLDAFDSDIEVRRYQDAEMLYTYCRYSAAPVGRLVLRVFGYRDDALDKLSDHICIGLQLLNHLQDMRDDVRSRDRVYFPKKDFIRFGANISDLRKDEATPELRKLVKHWANETAEHFQAGWPLLRSVKGRLGLELRAILHGAAAVLVKLRSGGYDVCRGSKPFRLGKVGKATILCRAVATRGMPDAFRVS